MERQKGIAHMLPGALPPHRNFYAGPLQPSASRLVTRLRNGLGPVDPGQKIVAHSIPSLGISHNRRRPRHSHRFDLADLIFYFLSRARGAWSN